MEPVKAILLTSGWSTSAAPVDAVARDDVHHARRELGLLEDLGQDAARVSGVVSAGFSTHVLPAASAGASFHAAMSRGKFHGMIWPATPSGWGFGAEAGVVELVGPAGVVEEVRGGERDVDVAGLADGLAVVERLHDREFTRALLDEPRDAEEVLRTLGASGLGPDLVVGAPRATRPRASTSSSTA